MKPEQERADRLQVAAKALNVSGRFEMQVYTYSEARQKLAEVLEKAESSGKVIIRRKDGRTFVLVPEKSLSSPLDVPSVKADISTQEIVDIIREGRERGRTWRSGT
jgi:antitoxin Phd